MKHKIVKYFDSYFGEYRYQLHYSRCILWGLIGLHGRVPGSKKFASYGLAEKWAKHYKINIPK